jgi:hypothetical protein
MFIKLRAMPSCRKRNGIMYMISSLLPLLILSEIRVVQLSSATEVGPLGS